MPAQASSTRKRPPDVGVPKPPSSSVRAKRRRRSSGWAQLRTSIRNAMQQVRVLVFVHVADAKTCLDVRMGAVFRWKKIGWMTLQAFATIERHQLEDRLLELEQFRREDLTTSTDKAVQARVDETLSRLAAHVLRGHVQEYRPLLAKLSPECRRQLNQTFDASLLETLTPPTDVLHPNSWFCFQTQSNSAPRQHTLQELGDFAHTKTWLPDDIKHAEKCVAFDTKAERARSISNIEGTINVLKCDAVANADDIASAKHLLSTMATDDKLMISRTRKYQLFPSAEQRQQLREYMGTCRWTYNQAVAHFRKTTMSKAAALRDLYVTKTTSKTRVYPDAMGPPPEWAFNTPKNFRYNTLRKFESNVKSAFSNKENGNIDHFKMRFKSRKNDGRYFTFCEDANAAKITYVEGEPRAMLSITKLENIPIRCDPGLKIFSEIQITNENGYWYAVILQYVRPQECVNQGRTIALDPGLKAFTTGVDLDGNALHIGRGNREHLDRLRGRAATAQRQMSRIKNLHGHRSGKQWRAFVRAKRAFDCATARMRNCVKELHYQTSAYLAKHYDTIVLPIFSSKSMIKKSCKRNHTYNKMLLGLKHFQFRELLKAKCEVAGKSLVVCSEMYTTQTCGRCSRLHLKIGNKDVFECPHCDHVAGRDVNAAFNILRFTCAGSLAVHAIHR